MDPGVTERQVPLVTAAHGMRDPDGVRACRELAELVRLQLPGVEATAGFVELHEPLIPQAVASALSASSDSNVVVVPLILGSGGHAKRDTPDAITSVREQFSLANIGYAEHLGPDPRLRAINLQRAYEASPAWSPASTTMVFVGRGRSSGQRNSGQSQGRPTRTKKAPSHGPNQGQKYKEVPGHPIWTSRDFTSSG